MKKLKKLRELAGLSQENLAKILQTTQQTIGRWESGKAEPNIAALRDLAMIFATSVDELIEFSKGAKNLTTSRYCFGVEGHDGFWGHIGLMLPGKAKSKWYPISSSQINYIDRASSGGAPWIIVDTLNNKRLFINRNEISRICLLDEACDQPGNDWEITEEEYHGAPQELYNCLDEFFYNQEELEGEASQTFIETLKDFVQEQGINEENYADRYLMTRIHSRNWDTFELEVERSDLSSLCLEIDLADNVTELPIRLSLDDVDGMTSSFLTREICLIEAPLHECIKASKELADELDRDAASSGIKKSKKSADAVDRNLEAAEAV